MGSLPSIATCVGFVMTVLGLVFELLALRSVRRWAERQRARAARKARAARARAQSLAVNLRTPSGHVEAAATIEVGVNIAASADVVPGGVDAAIAEQVRRYLGERLDAQEGALGEVVDDVDNAARWIMRGLVTGGIGVLLAGIGQVIR